MKIFKRTILLLILAGFIFFIISCSKEDNAEQAKEAITWQILNDIKADSLESYVTWMQNMGTRFTLSDNRRNVAKSIRNKFISFGYTDAVLDSFGINVNFRGTQYVKIVYNVIAVLETESPSDSVCILGGHYDSVIGSPGDPFITAPGANDNASGVAAALEIARVMKKNDFKPERAIKFVAFGAEEQGLYGSKYYASNALRSLERISFMLNNDMIAYEPSSDKTKWYVNIIDYSNSRYLRKEAERICTKYTLLKPVNNNTYSSSSDSYPFYTNGFRALFFFSNAMDPNYHTINDLASKCNFDYSAEIVKLNCAILVNKNWLP